MFTYKFYRLLFFGLLVLLECIFFDAYHHMLKSAIDWISDSANIQIFLFFVIYLPMVLIPIGSLNLSFVDYRDELLQNTSNSLPILQMTGLHLAASLFLSIFWFKDATGISSALIYHYETPKYLLLFVLIFLPYWLARKLTEKQNKSMISFVFLGTLILCLLWNLYFYFGLDDGCKTFGTDPLFGGGGYRDCDPDYISEVAHIKSLMHSRMFNTDSYYAVQFIWMSFLAYASLVISLYVLKNKKAV